MAAFALAVALPIARMPLAEPGPPARVVSINLCTDQLALLIAAPGQLVSVSDWARRPEASNMVAQASRLPANTATAEEVFLLSPDLVLAGSFTNAVTVDMLRRLALEVEIFEPVLSLSDIAGQIRRMGVVLGRQTRAEELAADLDAKIAEAGSAPADRDTPLAAYYYPNNYTSGSGTLAGDILERAGFENLAARLGYAGVAQVELEAIVMARPLLVESRRISRGDHGRAYESGAHPALEAIRDDLGRATVEERRHVCGTPFALATLEALLAARADLAE